MRQTILLVDDDHQITEALGMVLECPGRTVIVCSDIESAELALRRFDVTDIVTDVQFTGLFGFEGLHFVDRLRDRAPHGRIVLMTGYGSDVLRGAAAGYGAAALLGKPFEVAELERIIGMPGRTTGSQPAGSDDPGQVESLSYVGDDEPYELVRIPSIDEILAGGTLGTAFQPIMQMHGGTGEPFAYEALARIQGGWPGGGPAELFEYAAKKSRAVELNRVALVTSIEAAASLPAGALVFINIDPPTFNDPRLVDEVLDAAKRSGVSLERIVLEITEGSSMIGDAVLAETFTRLRASGVRFALDDHGSAHSHLPTISTIQPSFIKISGMFGTGFETDADKQRVIRHVVALAQDFGCATVLEGIESRATADAAATLGIELAQGYFYSVPRDVSHWREVAA